MGIVKGFLSLVLLFVSFLFSECSTEINLNNNSGQFPVVYGIIDPWSDSYTLYVTHTAQIDEGIYQAIREPERFCPDSISVRMEMWNDTLLVWYTDFHSEGTEKNPGLFANGNGITMVADRGLPDRNESDTLPVIFPIFKFMRFIISSPEFKVPAYSRIEYSKPVTLLKPYFSDQNVRLYGPEPLTISWPADEHFKYFDLNFQVYYSETKDTIRNSSVTFTYARDVQTTGSEYDLKVSPDRFLALFADKLIQDTTDCSQRHFLGFDIVLAAGDENFENYLVQSRIESPIYQRPWSNITNGLGIIALKSESKKEGFGFHSETLDSLALGKHTKQFRFARW